MGELYRDIVHMTFTVLTLVWLSLSIAVMCEITGCNSSYQICDGRKRGYKLAIEKASGLSKLIVEGVLKNARWIDENYGVTHVAAHSFRLDTNISCIDYLTIPKCNTGGNSLSFSAIARALNETKIPNMVNFPVKSGCTGIVFVRDPIERFISGYFTETHIGTLSNTPHFNMTEEPERFRRFVTDYNAVRLAESGRRIKGVKMQIDRLFHSASQLAYLKHYINEFNVSDMYTFQVEEDDSYHWRSISYFLDIPINETFAHFEHKYEQYFNSNRGTRRLHGVDPKRDKILATAFLVGF